MLQHAYAGWQRAHAMQAFPWNEPTRGSTAQRAGQQPAALDVLCPICSSPLTDAEIKEACQSAVRCLRFCLQQRVLAPYANGSYMHWQSAWQSVMLSVDLLFVAPCLAFRATAYMLACCAR